ncbi:MAG: DEAD/DEAH box helicase [Thermoplasmatota archaeon]
MHVAHPFLVPDTIEFRGYQANLARIASKRDTLVVVPTGMGKTVIALLVLADALQAGAGRILILAPTKPLIDQHVRFFQAVLQEPNNDVVGLTGDVPPAKREIAYQNGIVIATPQVVQNDLIAGRLDGLFDWVIYDECHRAVGEYPYTFIGQKLGAIAPKHRRMGMTASPGHDVAKIDEVRTHLGLDHVEIRTVMDADVRPFVQEVETEWETLPLPPSMDRVTKRLREAFDERVSALRKAGLLDGGGRPNRMKLLEVGRKLQGLIQRASDPDPVWFQGLSWQAQAMKLQHALEQAQTQGNQAFAEYISKMKQEAEGPKASKASRAVVEDHRVNAAYHIARTDDSETPKMGRVEVLAREQLEKDPDSRIIVFTHYRQTCEQVVERLAAIPGLKPVVFVGQGKRKGQGGLTQKQQAQIVQDFTAGIHNVLVATSVAEEGLDIPETDLVVFYEPIPSEIRSIQRRGRTGRKRSGRVVVLMTKGTQDEAAHWSSLRKEKQMVQELMTLRHTLMGREAPPKGQRTLDDVPIKAQPPKAAPSLFTGPRIVCDNREQPGQVVKHLSQLGAQVETRNLDVADFILSDRIVVERKTPEDLAASLVDGRLFDQLVRLKDYPKPILILEGEGIQTTRNIAPEALMGALASVTVDYGIPIMSTRDAQETARFLQAVAKREQGREGRRVAVRPTAGAKDTHGMRIHILASLPHISEVRAEALLARFGSVAAVFGASASALAEVGGIGPKIAADLRELLDGHAETLSTEA